MSFRRETPFDNIESAQQFVKLLIEAIEESKRDVDADIAGRVSNRSERQKQALQLVSNNLAKLSQHMVTSSRILKNLRALRRLLLEERQVDKHSTELVRGNDEEIQYFGGARFQPVDQLANFGLKK